MNRPMSLYLDIIRPLAALIVIFSHLGMHNLSGGQLQALNSAGVQAVDVFFVLSGFVIAHVCDTREKDLRTYMISRAARIYSVALPALLLIGICDAIGLRVNAEIYQGPFQTISPGLLIRSLLFIGEQWNTHRFPGSDGAYWSLGFEVWYYIAFGAFIFLPKFWRWPAMMATLLFIGPKVAIMFPAWLMGVATYHHCKKSRLREGAGLLLYVLSFVLITVYQFIPHSPMQQFIRFSWSESRLLSTAQDYFISVVFCMNIIGFSAISNNAVSWLERHAKTIRWIAGGTFSLYLAHLPIMSLLAAVSPWPVTSPYTLVLLIIGSPAGCMAFAEVSERRKEKYRQYINWMTSRVFPRP